MDVVPNKYPSSFQKCELVIIMMNDERYKTIIATLTANVERQVFRQIWYISEATS